jgi:release factor glutamine methyltransferase
MTYDELVARLRAAGCVFADDEARLLLDDAPTDAALTARVERREIGTPLEQVLGWVEFAGLRLDVGPGVFVPRRRTELLVRVAVDALRGRGAATVVDLCCGVGAVALAVASQVAEVGVVAVDIDPDAVACAARSARRLGIAERVELHTGDLDAPLPQALRGGVAVLTANAPYVPTAEIALMPREARLHERPVALDGGAGGVEVQRRVLDVAPAWLARGGVVAIESSRHGASALVRTAEAVGLSADVVTADDLDATVVVARVRP